MKKIKIGFVGAGKMAEAILAGLIAEKKYRPSEIGITTGTVPRRIHLKKKYGVVSFPSNPLLVASAPIIVLAVKPQMMKEVLPEIRPFVRTNQLYISIAAGKETRFFKKELSPRLKIIRTMPNNPSLVRSGTTGLYAPPGISPQDRKMAQGIMQAVGHTVWVKKENHLDTVTAISGSGPAYFYTLFETLIQFGKKRGLTEEMAKELACTTAIGAARMTLETGVPPLTLRDWVTSKKGTTEAALKVMARRHFAETLEQALVANVRRSEELRKI
ncbi:MAG: pyrroline-5-carboxylate reductase [Deltaproteobacteria bacterium]|nr:pyrroline-5-carboxylate reductase [Deltaproteobacteria bacterium]